jgi:hypothetical protein
MMGFNGVYCENLKKSEDANSARRDLYDKRRTDLVNDLVDPICVISNANEILSKKLGKFVDDETRSYFDMIQRSVTKTKTLVEELRNEHDFSKQ